MSDVRDKKLDQLNRKADLIDKHVGLWIKQNRQKMGLSQKDLAEAIGISYQQLQKYETGANRISAGRLYNLSQYMNIPIEQFFLNAPVTDHQIFLPKERMISQEINVKLSSLNRKPVEKAIHDLIDALLK